MRYDERIIDQVQTANDIVDVIGQVLPLKRSGRNLKANCPFHGEKTPSFMVNPEKQIYHCFGCGVGGSVFSFLMKYENLSFPEAVRQLAERANIPLPVESRGEKGAGDSEKIYEIYRLAVEYYRSQFLQSAQAKPARDYFFGRGYDAAFAEEFKIGWAPDGWRGLLEFLTKKGFPEPLLLKTGLVLKSPKGPVYDNFRARLLFPIFNLQGKPVAFGGRVIDDKGSPKYLNSPENPVFQKRRELYGLYAAKKAIDRTTPRLIVVEGYFDFLRLYKAGFKAAVATLGTALTPDHVQVLKRFADEAIVVYDGDKAGEAASLRGLEVFLEGGMNVRIARLPTGFDPDDFVEKKGNEAFQKILDDARDFFDYKLEVLLGRFNKRESLGLMKITDDFLETFLKVQNPVLLDRYLKRLAASVGVEENSLRTELTKLKKKESGRRTPLLPEKKERAPGEPSLTEEPLLFSLAFEDAKLGEIFLNEFKETDFSDPALRELYVLFAEQYKPGRGVAFSQILNRIPNEALAQKLIAFASMEWTSESRERAFADCLRKISQAKLQKRLEELRRAIAKAEREGDQAHLADYTRQYQDLWRQSKLPQVSPG